MRALVVGGGFIGAAVVDALESRGYEVALVRAPRYATAERDVSGLIESATKIARAAPPIDLTGVDVVVNCAGLATPTLRLSDALVGANALLPAVLAATIAPRPSCRFVHVSSASVQGTGVLDESGRLSPWSPYSRSKALGEQAVGRIAVRSTIYRPTSVHGPNRALTRSLARFASSSWSSVGGRGDGPSPVTHVFNVADGIAVIAEYSEAPPIVLHPSDGFTCAEVLRILGSKEPRRIPYVLARLIVTALGIVGRVSSKSAAIGRRLEVTWFGQRASAAALPALGWKPVVGLDAWRAMARQTGP